MGGRAKARHRKRSGSEQPQTQNELEAEDAEAQHDHLDDLAKARRNLGLERNAVTENDHGSHDGRTRNRLWVKGKGKGTRTRFASDPGSPSTQDFRSSGVDASLDGY